MVATLLPGKTLHLNSATRRPSAVLFFPKGSCEPGSSSPPRVGSSQPTHPAGPRRTSVQ